MNLRDWVVISIIGLSSFNLVFPFFGHTGGPHWATPEKTAYNQASLLLQCCDAYRKDMGVYPESLRELVVNVHMQKYWTGPYVQRGRIPKDPRGNDFVLFFDNGLVVGSKGPDWVLDQGFDGDDILVRGEY